MADPILKLEHITKRFAGHTAVRGLSLEVPPGGIFGLLGPNGAGTKTIRMIMNILVPDEGHVVLFGKSVMVENTPRGSAFCLRTEVSIKR